MTDEPKPSVIEWGSDRVRRLVGAGALPWRPYAAWAGALAGAIAAFGSLVSNWQTLTDDFVTGPDRVEVGLGLGLVWVWGGGWVLGAMVLSACTGLALLGPAAARAGARAIGLAAGGVLLPYLLAAAVALRRTNQSLFTMGNPQLEVKLGPAIPLALLATVLLLAALWFAPRAADLVWPPRLGGHDLQAFRDMARRVLARATAGRRDPGRDSGRRDPRRDPGRDSGRWDSGRWDSGRREPMVGQPAPDGLPAPGDLTVEPAEPWAAPPEQDGGR